MPHAPTDQELRSILVEILRMPFHHQTLDHIEHLFLEVILVAKRDGLKHWTGASFVDPWNDEGGRMILRDEWKHRVWDIAWDFVTEGVIRPGTIRNPNHLGTFPGFHLTEHGKKAVKDPMSPYDPEGTIARLRAKITNLDELLVTYHAESMHALCQNLFLSSTVALGIASERMMLVLIDATESALQKADQPVFNKTFGGIPFIRTKNEEYRKFFKTKIRPILKADNLNDFANTVENALEILFTYFRTIRNGAGHPTGSSVAREEAANNLNMFPYYVTRIYELMEWLDKKKPV